MHKATRSPRSADYGACAGPQNRDGWLHSRRRVRDLLDHLGRVPHLPTAQKSASDSLILAHGGEMVSTLAEPPIGRRILVSRARAHLSDGIKGLWEGTPHG